MDANQFGRLVAALRNEQVDFGPPQRTWSQKRLAEEAGLSKHTIESIEQGRLDKVHPETLLALARALGLNAGERKAFISAANGVRTAQLVPKTYSPETAMKHCLHRLENLYTPAYAFDPFMDIVAFNRGCLLLYNLHKDNPEGWKDRDPPPNNLNIFFTKDPLGVKDARPEIFDMMALRLTTALRIFSLPHRDNAYFPRLLAQLNRYRRFDLHWQEARTEETELIFGAPFPVIRWGVTIIASFISIESTAGTLRIISYSPANSESAERLDQLMQQAGTGVMVTSQWPKKPPYS